MSTILIVVLILLVLGGGAGDTLVGPARLNRSILPAAALPFLRVSICIIKYCII